MNIVYLLLGMAIASAIYDWLDYEHMLRENDLKAVKNA